MKHTSPHTWPAEWEPQAATWVAWPHNQQTWPEKFAPIPETFVKFVSIISQYQAVHVLSGPNAVPPSAHHALRAIANVYIHDIASNDTWIRDYGPTFVTRLSDGGLVGVDWKYNAWGGKYPPFDDDARAAELICREIGCPRSMSPMYCEGGALDTDGAGTLLTTSSCLLSPTRNPGWPREMIETELCLQLGVKKILWIDGGGLLGDDTDGHIDQLARFVSPGVVVAATSSRPDDANRAGLQANFRILQNASGANGVPLSVHALPTPPPRFVAGKRVPESYCNFLFANGIVLLPTFRHEPTDCAALELLTRLIPDRKIIPLDASDLILGLGAFHCASQQQPADRQKLAAPPAL